KVINTFLEQQLPFDKIREYFGKDNFMAVRLRAEGDLCFQTGKNEEAIELFSQALLFSEDSDEENCRYSYEESEQFVNLVPSLFDKRSAAFLKANHHYECILDIEELIRISGDKVSHSALLRLAHATTNLKD